MARLKKNTHTQKYPRLPYKFRFLTSNFKNVEEMNLKLG